MLGLLERAPIAFWCRSRQVICMCQLSCGGAIKMDSLLTFRWLYIFYTRWWLLG